MFSISCLFLRDKISFSFLDIVLFTQIRIRRDAELLPRSGSEIIVPDPDPAKYERADK